MELVAERARWGRRLPAGHGLGIAVHRSFVSYVAAVVEAAVGKDGTVSVPCVDMAVDCGFAAYPDRIRPQMEGPAVMALSSALYGEMTFREGRALQNNFNDFQVARMNVAPGRLTCTSSRAMRRPVGSGNRGCHHSLRRCATRSSPRSGSGFAACPSRISCEAKRTSKGRPAMTLADKTATAVTTCALAIALGLVLLTMPVWGQAGQAGEQSAQTGWFRVSWAPPTEGVVSSIRGSVFNDSLYRVTDVHLQVEGLGPDGQPVGRTLAWAFGDIAPAGETSFVAEPLPGAVSYRITVVSFDLVSLDQVR